MATSIRSPLARARPHAARLAVVDEMPEAADLPYPNDGDSLAVWRGFVINAANAPSAPPSWHLTALAALVGEVSA